MKNYKVYYYKFDLTRDYKYMCRDPRAFAGTLADLFHLLGIESMPDTAEFLRLKIDDDKSVWINFYARLVVLRFINFQISDLCTNHHYSQS